MIHGSLFKLLTILMVVTVVLILDGVHGDVRNPAECQKAKKRFAECDKKSKLNAKRGSKTITCT